MVHFRIKEGGAKFPIPATHATLLIDLEPFETYLFVHFEQFYFKSMYFEIEKVIDNSNITKDTKNMGWGWGAFVPPGPVT